MSHRLFNRSPDLQRLQAEGFEVEECKGYLLVGHVPYVTPKREVAFGTLISRLDLAGADTTTKPKDHVAMWAGEYPCDSKGSKIEHLVNNPNLHEEIRPGLVATHSFSSKPGGGYEDYYLKMTSYVRILEGHAHVLDPNATAQTYPVVKLAEEESVFCYADTASSRAGISAIAGKLEKGRIAIVGLGGTGSYILDHVAKTPVAEVHLFDSDPFLQHNAFRCPGAPSVSDLDRKLSKVAWFAEVYSKMRRKIVPHPVMLTGGNVEELVMMDFVFLCLDKGEHKRSIINHLVQHKIPFIDTGMGLDIRAGAIGGLVRVTTSTPSQCDHLPRFVSYAEGNRNEYAQNIQISDLNALNAALAVIKWKKLWGFYSDAEREYNTVYGVETNLVTNDGATQKADLPQS